MKSGFNFNFAEIFGLSPTLGQGVGVPAGYSWTYDRAGAPIYYGNKRVFDDGFNFYVVP